VPVVSAIFLKKTGSGMHSDSKFGQRGGVFSYIDARKERFWNAVPAWFLLRKNLRNSVLHVLIKIPLPIVIKINYRHTVMLSSSFQTLFVRIQSIGYVERKLNYKHQ
jgi:hypothetical protein